MEKTKNLKKILKSILLVIIAAAVIFYFVYQNGSRQAAAGIAAPIQTQTEGYTKTSVNDYNAYINYLYEYNIEALVVHTKDYFGFGFEDTLSPKDLALAWGPVAEYNTQIDFHWGQSGRWYFWKVDSIEELGKAGGNTNIGLHSSNNHIIPADETIKWQVRRIRRGDHIRLKGYLVNVDAYKPDGSSYYWHSSTSRSDTGNGSC